MHQRPHVHPHITNTNEVQCKNDSTVHKNAVTKGEMLKTKGWTNLRNH